MKAMSAITTSYEYRRLASLSWRLVAFWLMTILIASLGHVAYGQPGRSTKAAAQPKGPKGMPKGYEKIVAVTLPAEVADNVCRRGLVRELGRQALLIAAESELGLITLDRSIGEVIPTGSVARGPFIVNTVYGGKAGAITEGIDTPNLELALTITRYEQSGTPFQWSAPAVTYMDADWLETYVEHVESLSRGPLVEALQKAGYAKASSTAKAAAASTLKDQIDLVSQFALARSLHSELLIEETPELLGNLVRCYANLGSLSDVHWSPASKAYKARSLLYSQRLIAKCERTPFSLAHRAYAFALAGRVGTASAAIEEAKDAKGTAAPAWLPLIAAYCQYEPAVLEKETEDSELAMYLRLRMLDLSNDEVKATEMIMQGIPRNHANTRVIEMLPEISRLGVRRQATEIEFFTIWPHLYQQIGLIPNLPATAKATAIGSKNRRPSPVGEYSKRKELIGQLQSVTGIKNQPGPHWPVLADMLRNVSLVQAWHTLVVKKNDLGVETMPVLKALSETVRGHHFENALLIFGEDTEREFDAMRKLASDPDSCFCELPTLAFYNSAISILGSDISRSLLKKILLTADALYDDSLQLIEFDRRVSAKTLLSINPNWPPAIAYAILNGGDQSLAELEQKYGKSAYLLQALYVRYTNLKQPQDALRCLKKAVELAPSCDGCRALAEFYKSQGDTDAWHQALMQALEHPSLGLEHASIHYDLAEWHIGKSEWDKAEPHALAAAESFSDWGLIIGAKWAEGADKWKEAEQFTIDRAVRYQLPTSYLHWCLRTGHGDREAARKMADDFWGDSQQIGINFAMERAIYTLAAGDRQKSKDELYDMFSKRGDASAGLYVAVLADEDGDIARRDAIFKELETTRSSQFEFIELSNCFRGVLSGKESGRWNTRVLDLLVTKAKLYPARIYFLAGTFLGRHGDAELSELYLRLAANDANFSEPIRLLANLELQKKKLPTGKPENVASAEAIATYNTLTHDLWKPLTEGRVAEAETTLNQALQTLPGFTPALLTRAAVRERQERYADAIADLEQVVKDDPNFYYARIQLARILSTCDKAEFRNGTKALEHAEKAAAWREFDTGLSLSALASAYAECGNFAKAVEVQTKARPFAAFDRTFDARLKLYKAGKPYHVKHNTTSPDTTVDLSWLWR